MSLEMWLAFAIAATILMVIPGPTIILVISQAIAYGRKAVIPLVVGVVLGDFTAMLELGSDHGERFTIKDLC
jgi:threonine/homoserine/homoserine lactone efflux protein